MKKFVFFVVAMLIVWSTPAQIQAPEPLPDEESKPVEVEKPKIEKITFHVGHGEDTNYILVHRDKTLIKRVKIPDPLLNGRYSFSSQRIVDSLNRGSDSFGIRENRVTHIPKFREGLLIFGGSSRKEGFCFDRDMLIFNNYSFISAVRFSKKPLSIGIIFFSVVAFYALSMAARIKIYWRIPLAIILGYLAIFLLSSILT